jgi:hypothetical protein
MGLEPKWTDLSDMLATRTDDQLLKWKEVAENPRIDNYRSITTLRQLVVDLYNKSIKDIINELSLAVNDELNSRKEDINMDKKLEARIERLEKSLSHRSTKNEDFDEDRVKFQDAYNKACKSLSACIVNLNKMYNFGDSMNLTYDIGDVIERCEKAMDHLLEMNHYIK